MNPFKGRAFFLTRHGQSEYNREGKIGGDSGLAPLGRDYAKALATYAWTNIGRDKESGADVPARLWTSTLRRTIETASWID